MEKGERRRKIISRGNDRLALITGKIQSLDSDNGTADHVRSSSETAARDEKSFLQEKRRHGGDNVPETIMDHDNEEEVSKENDPAVVSKGPDPGNDRGTISKGNDGGTVSKGKDRGRVPKGKNRVSKGKDQGTVSKGNDQGTVSKGKDQGTVSKGKNQGMVVPNLQKCEKKEVAPLKSDIANLAEKYLGYYLGSVSLKEINFSIITTEDIRVMCTIVLAIMVVLYHAFLPQNVPRPKSLIAHRPMYVLLLTEVLIVAIRLAPFAHRRMEGREPQIQEEVVDGQDWGGAIKLMEMGLVLHQTIRALFIDLSFYVAIVVSGLYML